jgi:hypothetical protein
MDIKDRVMGDQPDDILHKIASIVPGYEGYVDRERRRDADKLLRTQLARQYSAQRDRLNRVQQGLARGRQMEHIAEVDRLVGVLQRFIDRLSTATYGYSGLFDPIKVEAVDLDQIYAFDMALASGVDQVSAAVGALEAAATPSAESPGARSDLLELPASIARLSSVVDELNQRLDQRADLLTSGRRLAENDYNAMLSNLKDLPPTYSQATQGGSSETPRPSGSAPAQPSGEMARYPGSAEGASREGEGIPTTNLSMRAAGAPEPGMSSIVEGNQGFTEMPSGAEMSAEKSGSPLPAGGSAGTGIETGSSPTSSPGAPGGDIVEGLDMANDVESATRIDTGQNSPKP